MPLGGGCVSPAVFWVAFSQIGKLRFSTLYLMGREELERWRMGKGALLLALIIHS